MSSPGPSAPSTPSAPPAFWTGAVTLRVRLFNPSTCEDCAANDYEDIEINALTDTVENVKYNVATQLGLEVEEFVFGPVRDYTKYESKPGVLFADVYITSEFMSGLKEGCETGQFDICLYEDTLYSGNTGMLKWILRRQKVIYCDELCLYDHGQLVERLARYLSSFRVQQEIIFLSAPHDGSAIIRVQLSGRNVCEDCGDDDYEDIEINVLTDTVEQITNAIATRLGIEAEEFVYYHKYDEEEYESESEALFSTVYMRSDYVARLLEGYYEEPFEIYLYMNKEYKGKTGMLKWIMSQKTDYYCSEHYPEGGQLAERLSRHIAAFKAEHNIPSPLDSWDGMVNLRVSFPELEVCNNCEAYEDVIINTREDTVEQVKNAIAIKLGIEVDEFVLGRENDKNEHKSELEMLFSNIYMPINYKPDTDENGDWVPFEHPLYANKFYKGKTGTLSRIISEKKDVYCREYDFDGGQLAHGFASQRAVFNPWNTNP